MDAKLSKELLALVPQTFQGIMLTGNMTVCTDRESRERLWREGFEMYDMSILLLTFIRL